MIDAFVQNILNNTKFEQEKITSSGSWTVPTGIYEVTAILVGGGGSGVTTFGQGGGGGEIFIAHNYPVFPADSISVTVGAGGVQAGAPTYANVGGYTSFGNLSANGGGAYTTSGGGKGSNRGAGGGVTYDSTMTNGGITSAGGRFISISGGGTGSVTPGGNISDTPFSTGGANFDGANWYRGGGASWGKGGDSALSGAGEDGIEGGGGGAGDPAGDGGDGLIILCYRKTKRH
jgi:hypothetical protein